MRDSAAHRSDDPARPRTLCIAVDDFGLHAGINDAALQLATMDRVHAVGCMVGGPAWRAGSLCLQRLDPASIDVGLHLDLSEHPMQPQSRRSLGTLIAGSLLRQLDRHALRVEIRGQLQAFEQAMGRPPSYVDGHRHVHQLPLVRQELLDELSQRYGTLRPWLRSTRRARQAPLNGWREATKAMLIEHLGASALATLAQPLGYPANRHLLGVYDFKGGPARYRRLLAAWLDAAGRADLLMCHPSAKPAGTDALIEARAAEFQVLSSEEFGTLRDDMQVLLWPMSRILAQEDACA